DGLGAVPGLGDHFQVGLPVQDEPDPPTDQGMVVGEQNPDLGRVVLVVHDCFLTAGTVSRIRVPDGDAGLMSSVAPSSSARSRIPRIPAPSRATPMPRPSSSTSSTTEWSPFRRLTRTVPASACRAALVSPSC